MPINPAAPQPTSSEGRAAAKIAALERRLATLEKQVGGGTSQLPVVAALPTAGRPGRHLFNKSDGKVYVDNGSAWVPQT